jgi:hypothetical protein
MNVERVVCVAGPALLSALHHLPSDPESLVPITACCRFSLTSKLVQCKAQKLTDDSLLMTELGQRFSLGVAAELQRVAQNPEPCGTMPTCCVAQPLPCSACADIIISDGASLREL